MDLMFWINIWRILIFTICFLSFLIMTVGFKRHRKNWNTKTRNYWAGRVMWTCAGMAITLESLIRHTPWRINLIFLTAAALVTLKGNLQKGSWGAKYD